MHDPDAPDRDEPHLVSRRGFLSRAGVAGLAGVAASMPLVAAAAEIAPASTEAPVAPMMGRSAADSHDVAGHHRGSCGSSVGSTVWPGRGMRTFTVSPHRAAASGSVPPCRIGRGGQRYRAGATGRLLQLDGADYATRCTPSPSTAFSDDGLAAFRVRATTRRKLPLADSFPRWRLLGCDFDVY